MADNDTIADIIAEMRALSNTISDGIIAINGRIIADRIEAAHKRELGDCAKLREALDESRRIASDLGGCRLNDYWKLNEIVRVCEAALAAPPRNCDVGTADDWLARFSAVCERCSGSDCDHRLFKDEEVCDCFARWLQMPYEEGVQNAE